MLLFVLPDPKGDILLWKAQLEELGLMSTRRLRAQTADKLQGAINNSDELSLVRGRDNSSVYLVSLINVSV